MPSPRFKSSLPSISEARSSLPRISVLREQFGMHTPSSLETLSGDLSFASASNEALANLEDSEQITTYRYTNKVQGSKSKAGKLQPLVSLQHVSGSYRTDLEQRQATQHQQAPVIPGLEIHALAAARRRGTFFIPTLRRIKPETAHKVSARDLLVTQASSGSIAGTYTNSDSHLLEESAPLTAAVVHPCRCTAGLGKHSVISVSGREWDAYALPHGGCEFFPRHAQSIDNIVRLVWVPTPRTGVLSATAVPTTKKPAPSQIFQLIADTTHRDRVRLGLLDTHTIQVCNDSLNTDKFRGDQHDTEEAQQLVARLSALFLITGVWSAAQEGFVHLKPNWFGETWERFRIWKESSVKM